MTCTARRHGDQSAYNHYGCRCASARESARLYRKRHREHRQPAALVDATGSRRRLQAMLAMGWPQKEICKRLGWSSHRTFQHVVNGQQVHRKTHEAIQELADELAMTPGPSAVTRGKSRALGHRTVLAWDDIDRDPEPPVAEPLASRDDVDHAAVVRAASGDKLEVLRDEDRRQVVDRLTREGQTNAEIAGHLGITIDRVDRDRDTLAKRRKREKEREREQELELEQDELQLSI